MPKPQRTRQHGTPSRTPEQQPPRDGVDRSADAQRLLEAYASDARYPRSHYNRRRSSGNFAPIAATTALVALAGAALWGIARNDSSEVRERAKIEAAVDNEAEMNKLKDAKVWQGTLIINEGANIRHDPRVDKVSSDGTDFTDNLAIKIPEGMQFKVDNPIVWSDSDSGDSYFGFSYNDPITEKQPSYQDVEEGNNGGIYWLRADVVGQGYANFYRSPDEIDPRLENASVTATRNSLAVVYEDPKFEADTASTLPGATLPSSTRLLMIAEGHFVPNP